MVPVGTRPALHSYRLLLLVPFTSDGSPEGCNRPGCNVSHPRASWHTGPVYVGYSVASNYGHPIVCARSSRPDNRTQHRSNPEAITSLKCIHRAGRAAEKLSRPPTWFQDTVGLSARNKLGWRHAWILWDPLFEVSRRTAETPGRRQRCLGALEPNHMLVDRERRPTHPIELYPRASVMFQKSPFCPGTLPRTLKRSSCTAGVRSYESEHGRSAQRCRCGSMRER